MMCCSAEHCENFSSTGPLCYQHKNIGHSSNPARTMINLSFLQKICCTGMQALMFLPLCRLCAGLHRRIYLMNLPEVTLLEQRVRSDDLQKSLSIYTFLQMFCPDTDPQTHRCDLELEKATALSSELKSCTASRKSWKWGWSPALVVFSDTLSLLFSNVLFSNINWVLRYYLINFYCPELPQILCRWIQRKMKLPNFRQVYRENDNKSSSNIDLLFLLWSPEDVSILGAGKAYCWCVCNWH